MNIMDFSVISFLLKAKLSYVIFHPLEFVSHYRNPQLQVDEKSTFLNLDNLALFLFPYFDLLIKQLKDSIINWLDCQNLGCSL